MNLEIALNLPTYCRLDVRSVNTKSLFNFGRFWFFTVFLYSFGFWKVLVFYCFSLFLSVVAPLYKTSKL